ncbi:peptide transporter PTR3-A-like protein [Medicago truncatula]|uniref:Peptide transporter PTR3-A-like protein n=1 Tax=Medicago truncatula TaxID=3880 RepID=A0A072U2M7_MEDTR|nr:peptide transporter PTR3-A-like protein [Medicago truncatula]
MTMLGENGKEDYTEDGTVDLKGRPVLRSNTGRWRACSFIVVHHFEEPVRFGSNIS